MTLLNEIYSKIPYCLMTDKLTCGAIKVNPLIFYSKIYAGLVLTSKRLIIKAEKLTFMKLLAANPLKNNPPYDFNKITKN
jgi:hypothetical protein